MGALGAASTIASANNQFALDLYKNLIVPKKPDENAFISPFSVLAALSMINVGAQGSTRDEISTSTKLKGISGGNPSQIDAAFKELYAKFKIQTAPGPAKKDIADENAWEPLPAYLALANRVYLQKGSTVKPKFASTLKDSYNTTFGNADFAKNPTGAAKEINSWVESVTNGKIKNLFDKFEPNTRLALASAIYFKAQWENRFYESQNAKKDFHVSAEKNVKADFMDMWDDDAKFADLSEADATGLLKQYSPNDDFHMIVILPNKKDGLNQLENGLTEKLFDSSRYQGANIHITFPKFKFEDSYDLKKGLQKIGIQKAFSNEADFGALTPSGDVPVKIGDAVHKSFVAVDEKGTEAAAATGIKAVPMSAVWPEKPRKAFNADHPFIFAIQHRETSALLFLGRVRNPSATPSPA